jgi:hypothetical protein
MRNEKGQFVKGDYQGFGFKKGTIPWNKNKKGIHLSEKTEFKKGMTPWNKGIGKGWIDEGYHKVSINGKDKRNHRVIMEEYLGRKLDKCEIVHHMNGKKKDNIIKNLVVLTRSEHTKIHKIWLGRGKKKKK